MRLHALDGRGGALGEGGIVRQEEPDDAKDRFARVERRIAALEVVGSILPLLDAQKALGQPLVDAFDG